jgi:hypothetical protein
MSLIQRKGSHFKSIHDPKKTPIDTNVDEKYLAVGVEVLQSTQRREGTMKVLQEKRVRMTSWLEYKWNQNIGFNFLLNQRERSKKDGMNALGFGRKSMRSSMVNVHKITLDYNRSFEDYI